MSVPPPTLPRVDDDATLNPRQRRAAKLVRDKHRAREAASKFRHRIGTGRYDGLRLRDSDDLDRLAALVDAAGIELDALPSGTRSALLAVLSGFLRDDQSAAGDVRPLSDGPGH